MPTPWSAAWDFLRGRDFQTTGAIAEATRALGPNPISQAIHRGSSPDFELQRKFTPASSEIDWVRVNSLMYTYGQGDSTKGDGNSAVFACLMALSLGAIEPPLRVFKEVKDKREPLANHVLMGPRGLLRRPNGFHRPRELWFWKTWAEATDGNAYFLKMRAGNERTGNVVELWPISPSIISPYTAEGSSNYIDGYKRWVSGNEWVIDPPENIIHFRNGIDDRDHRKGLSNLKRLVRQISSDEAATRWTDNMLRIGGAASMMVTVPKETTISPEQAEELRDRIEQRFTGDRAGSIGVLTGGAKAERYGFSPSEMDLAAIHNVPETRICAVIGVHPAVAMMSAGLSQTANFSSLKEIYTAFTERRLAPLWVNTEETLNQGLLPDFDSSPNVLIAHDLGEVRALQEDVDAKWQRVILAWDKGILTLDQTLSELGMDPEGGEDGGKRKAAPAPTATFGGGKPELGTQPVDKPAPGAPGKGLAIKSDDLDRWPDLMDALVNLAEPSFTEDLDRYFDDQRRRLNAAIARRQAL